MSRLELVVVCLHCLWKRDHDLHIGGGEHPHLAPHLPLQPVLVKLLLQPVDDNIMISFYEHLII